jgi:hypothetical protein
MQMIWHFWFLILIYGLLECQGGYVLELSVGLFCGSNHLHQRSIKSQEADDKRQAAREVIDILQEISDLLVRAHPQ